MGVAHRQKMGYKTILPAHMPGMCWHNWSNILSSWFLLHKSASLITSTVEFCASMHAPYLPMSPRQWVGLSLSARHEEGKGRKLAKLLGSSFPLFELCCLSLCKHKLLSWGQGWGNQGRGEENKKITFTSHFSIIKHHIVLGKIIKK